MAARAGAAVLACLAGLAAASACAARVLGLLPPARLYLAYLGCEAVFAVVYCYRWATLSYSPIRHRPLQHDPGAAFERALQHLSAARVDARSWLSTWFRGAAFASIRRGNVADLVAYAFWSMSREDVDAEGRGGELQAQVAALEATFGLELPPGHNPQLRYMAHSWEALRHWWKPLAFYAFSEAAAALTHLGLVAAGFKRHSCMGVAYFTRNMPQQQPAGSTRCPDGSTRCRDGSGTAAAASPSGLQAAPAPAPLLLLHGIGMGLLPYTSFLLNLAATGRPVIALDCAWIAQRWVLWLPTVDEVAEVVSHILRREGAPACCLVAHSYGSAVASRLLQTKPHRVQHLCLIDPICFSMHQPSLLRNFLYETPNSGNLPGDLLMQAAARDLHVAATLSRRFFWSDVNLWEEQVPAGSLVVLSGRDVLMQAEQVQAWLQERSRAAAVVLQPHLVHAGFLLDLGVQADIIARLLPLLDAAAAAAATAAAAAAAGRPAGGASQASGAQSAPVAGDGAGMLERAAAAYSAAHWTRKAGSQQQPGACASIDIIASLQAGAGRADGEPGEAGRQSGGPWPLRALGTTRSLPLPVKRVQRLLSRRQKGTPAREAGVGPGAGEPRLRVSA